MSTQVAVATPAHRRAIRTKLLGFYGKHEPEKSVQDINDLVDWALVNGIETLNGKLAKKYGEDLNAMKSDSMAALPLLTQLKIFYGEFDPSKKLEDIKKVDAWVSMHGLLALNERMFERYGENLNSIGFGGKDHLQDLLEAFYKRHDPSKLMNPEEVRVIMEWAVTYGSVKLNEKLAHKYGDVLHLSVEDIEKSIVALPSPAERKTLEEATATGRSRAMSELPTPDAWKQMNSGSAKAARGGHVRLSMRSLTSGMSSAHVGNKEADPMLDPEHLQKLIELFYARYAPQKLVEGAPDKVVQWALRHGVAEINTRMRTAYNTDLDELEEEYEHIYDELEKFYLKHDPRKLDVAGGLDDVAGWAIVHGVTALNERLQKKFNATITAPPASQNKKEVAHSAPPRGFTPPLSGSTPPSPSHTPAPQPLGAGVSPTVQRQGSNTTHRPSVIGAPPPPAVPVVSVTPPPPSSAASSASAAKPSRDEEHSIKPTTSFADRDAPNHNADTMEDEMHKMREITSGNYSHLALRLAAFYQKHDPEKLKDQAAVDTIIRWALKNGVDNLNKRLTDKWGENLDDVKIPEPPAQTSDKNEDAEPNW